MTKSTSRSKSNSIKHMFAAVCQSMYLGDGCECTYSQVSVNRTLRTIACSFRSGADGSFATTSVVIGFGGFVGSVVVQPDALYSPKPLAHCVRSFEEYVSITANEEPQDDLSWEQLLGLFLDIEIVGEDEEGLPEMRYFTPENIGELPDCCDFGENLEPITVSTEV